MSRRAERERYVVVVEAELRAALAAAHIDVEVSGIGRLSNKVVEVPAPRANDGFPASPDSEGVRRVALGNEERLPDKFKASK